MASFDFRVLVPDIVDQINDARVQGVRLIMFKVASFLDQCNQEAWQIKVSSLRRGYEDLKMT